MTTPDHADITRLVQELSEGREGAADALVPLIYQELHGMASRALRREADGHTLQPTALVHEAFLRIVSGSPGHFNDRAHFFAFAARIMRRVLVDQARARLAGKRQGALHGGVHVTLDNLGDGDAGDVEQRTLDVIAIEDALSKLEALDARAARVVELRVFAGLTIEETGETLDVAISTIKRDWLFARAFLKRELKVAEAER